MTGGGERVPGGTAAWTRTAGAGLAMLAAAIAGPAGAQRPAPRPLPAERPALAVIATLDAATDDKQRLAIVDRALALLPQPTPFRGAALCERGALLARLDRPAEARTSFDQCRALRPDDGRPLVAIAYDEASHDRAADAARLVLRAVRIDPRALDGTDSDSMNGLLRQLRYAGADTLYDQLVAVLADTGFARSDAAAFSTYTLGAVGHHVETGELDQARALLPSIIAPADGVTLLIDRRYAPIWPAVEAWAGGDLSAQRAALIASARAAFTLDPAPAARLHYADALAATGSRAEAIGLVGDWLDTLAEPGEDAYYRAMAASKLGRWLSESGRADVAVARMRAELQKLPKDEPARGNIVPNLANIMLLAHDAAGALALLDRETPAAKDMESPSTVGIFVTLRACALEGLGRHEQAVALLRRVQSDYASVDRAVADALACVGTPDEQARGWIADARNPRLSGERLVGLATARYHKRTGTPPRSFRERTAQLIEDRPDVRRAFDALARPLPPVYEPALDNFEGARPLPGSAAHSPT